MVDKGALLAENSAPGVMTATKGVSDQRGVWSCWNVYKLKVQRVIN